LDGYRSDWRFVIGELFPLLDIIYPSSRANSSRMRFSGKHTRHKHAEQNRNVGIMSFYIALLAPSIHADLQNRLVKLTASRDSQDSFENDFLQVLQVLSLSFYYHVCPG
jgi:hypothetical protein